jgi:5-hydroxyisourate hydrolase-like protein (transthyretin family)
MGSRQVKLTAVLKDSAGNPLANKTISFSYKASTETTWISAGTATTDSTGTASVTVTVTTPGTYDFSASFAGDDQYEASSATVTNYTVKDKTSITLTVTPL